MADVPISVLVDACSHHGAGGISYLRTLLPALAGQAGIASVTAVTEARAILAEELAPTPVRVERRGLAGAGPAGAGLGGRLLWEATALRRAAPDTVVLTPSAMLPRALGAPVVAVPQNILPFLTSGARLRLQRAAIGRTLGFATAAIFPTDAMRDQVARFARLPELEATIPCALHEAFLDPVPEDRVRNGIIVIADQHPHKRLELALEAWRRLGTGRPALTVIGTAGGGRVVPGVRFEPWLEPSAVASALRGAQVALLPSRAESFGLPAIEALACRTPLVASDIPALRETTGGHALLVAGGAADLWGAAIRRVLSAPPPSSPGADWARRFTAQRTAAATAEILLEAHRRRTRGS
jgi:glycosyltransferase involved in cell wall biosynthesis